MSVESMANVLAVVRRLGMSIALFLVLPLLFLLVYIEWLHAPTNAFAVHLRVVAEIAVAMAGIRLLIGLLPVGILLRRVLASVMIACVLFGFIALYAGAFVGMKFWGRVASVQLLSTYVSQGPETLKALGISLYGVAGAIGVLFLLIAIAVFWYLKKYDWVSASRETLSPATLGIVTAGLLCVFAIYVASFEAQGWAREAEPLSLALFPGQGEVGAQSHHMNFMRMAELQKGQDASRTSYVPSVDAHRSNVVLIVVDAFRADHLSLLGYRTRTTPNLEHLRSQGTMTVATSAVAVCNESFCGLRGFASSQSVANQAERPFTMHEVLKKYGYKVNLILSGDHTHFYGLSHMYGQVDSYFDGASQRGRYVNDDRLLLDHLDAQPKWDGTPVMFQFHLMSSHPLGLRFDETPEFGPGRAYVLEHGTSAQAVKSAVNYYDRGVLQADTVISELLSKLKALGYLEDALVVITGDHGESLGEHGLYTHAQSVWEESLRVPFLLMSFGQADPVSLLPAKEISQVDIAPTLLHALGMKVPDSWEGVALQVPYNRRYIDFQQNQFLGLIDTQSDALYKFWIDTRSGQKFTFSLVSADKEKTDVTGQVPAALQREWREYLIKQSATLPVDAHLGF
ncbi:sulfatase-like hydrolase/transferase [Pseudomonas sp. QL9]|uniref:sulfatase-like hydrolase/transferase n=1 Tax=Pseudomonas sp. QL9 TaxID=3242725 RepID=UPI00352B0BD6